MIKSIFLPETTKTRRLISKRILGLTLQEDTFYAAQVYATSKKTFIEKVTQGPNTNEGIQRLIATSKFDRINIAIPSSIVTFKELTLPFLDIDKIRMVIEYEVEAMLPFAIHEAIIDFIITDQDVKNKKSQILVAAIREQDLTPIFDTYRNAGIDSDIITIDLISLYSLYLQIPSYKQLPRQSALINIEQRNTSIAFLTEGQLRLIRTLPKGIQHLKEETQITDFLNEIQFTLNSFALKLSNSKEINKVFFTGQSDLIPNLLETCNKQLQLTCEFFACEKLFKTGLFKNNVRKLVTKWGHYAVALGTAIPYQPFDEFNLRKKTFEQLYTPLAGKQIIAGLILAIIIFITVGLRGFWEISDLHSTSQKKEAESIVKLTRFFPPTSPLRKKKNYKILLKEAETTIARKKESWAPFIHENLQPLEILQDLTITMEQQLFNITIEKVSLERDNQGMPLVEITGLFKSKPGAHFKDFGTFVKNFEQASKMFVLKDRPEEELTEDGVKFTFKLKSKEKPIL